MARGEVIARSGESGAGPPHLHLEIRNAGNVPVNPLLHDYSVTDTKAPTLQRIALVPMDSDSRVNGRPHPRFAEAAPGNRSGKICGPRCSEGARQDRHRRRGVRPRRRRPQQAGSARQPPARGRGRAVFRALRFGLLLRRLPGCASTASAFLREGPCAPISTCSACRETACRSIARRVKLPGFCSAAANREAPRHRSWGRGRTCSRSSRSTPRATGQRRVAGCWSTPIPPSSTRGSSPPMETRSSPRWRSPTPTLRALHPAEVAQIAREDAKAVSALFRFRAIRVEYPERGPRSARTAAGTGRARIHQDPVRPDSMVPIADAPDERRIGSVPEHAAPEHHVVVSQGVILPELRRQ